MHRLFVIIPLWLLVMTFGLITYRFIMDSPNTTQAQISELRTRIEILERHLDSTGD